MRVAILGFGNVGRALARLIVEQRERLPVPIAVTAIVTGRHGTLVAEDGIDLERALAAAAFPDAPRPAIDALPADAIVELTPLDARTGGPALEHIRDALTGGKHVVTANKGPIAVAHRELTAL